MGKVKLEDLPDELISNTNILIPKINQMLEEFGEYRKCNSGYRSIEDQKRINPSAMKSKHLKCAAIDLSDKDGRLNKWLKDNPQILEKYDFYCEERQGLWQHIQIIPPTSHKRWFNP